jgi:hypothetical protein
MRSLPPCSTLHDERNFAITGETRPMPPAGSTLPRLASEVDSTLVLLDPVHGAMGLQEQLAALVDTTDAERVALVDVGGDILGTGTEPELKSPLADALALAATDGLPVPVEVLVAGAGLDGELSEQTVLSRIRQLGGRLVMRVGPADAAWAMPVFDWHPSEAAALPGTTTVCWVSATMRSSTRRSPARGAFLRATVSSRRFAAARSPAGQPNRDSSSRTAAVRTLGPCTRSSAGWIRVSRPRIRLASRVASWAWSSS